LWRRKYRLQFRLRHSASFKFSETSFVQFRVISWIESLPRQELSTKSHENYKTEIFRAFLKNA